jgi:hypothetical protein
MPGWLVVAVYVAASGGHRAVVTQHHVDVCSLAPLRHNLPGRPMTSVGDDGGVVVYGAEGSLTLECEDSQPLS